MYKRQGWYNNVIWAGDPINADLVIVGGINLWRSLDGGKTVARISSWSSDQSAHADQHVIVADPEYDGVNNWRVFFGNDGGIYKTENVTTVGNNATEPYTNGWDNLNNGYGVTQFYGVAAHAGKRIVIAGAQDNGTVGHTPGEFFWDKEKVSGGDGGYVAADQRNPGLFYGEYVYGAVLRSDRVEDPDTKLTAWAAKYICGNASVVDAQGKPTGSFFDGKYLAAHFGEKFKDFYISEAKDGSAEFIAPFVLDPDNSNVMLVGCKSLWRTTNAAEPPATAPAVPGSPERAYYPTNPAGPTWKIIKLDSRDGTITALATGYSPGVGQTMSNVILVGHSNGAIYLTTNGNIADDQIALTTTPAVPEWKKINTPVACRCNCLVIDPDDPGATFYAGFGGFGSDNLWKTTDGGVTWTDISGELPAMPIYAITLHPKNPDWVYVGAEHGVFASEDGGKNWAATNEGPANVPCYGFTWIGQTLLVATHGRGVFQIDLTISDLPKALWFGDASGTFHRIDTADAAGKSSSIALSGGSPLGDALVVDAERAKTIGDAYGPDYEAALSGRAFLGDASGKVYCVIDAAPLGKQWSTPVLSGNVHVSPALLSCSSCDMVYLLVVTDAGRLHLLNPSDGTEPHKLHPTDPKENWPVVLPNFGANDRVWSCEVMDNWAFVTSTCGTYAVRLHPDASVEWHHTASASSQPALMADNSCFVSGINGRLYKLKARTAALEGEDVWSQDTGARITTVPAWSVGAVVVGNATGRLVGYDHVNGTELFSKDDPAGSEIQSLGADDARIYWVGSKADGTAALHALDVTPKPPGPGTWPVSEPVDYPKPVAGAPGSPPLTVTDQLYLYTFRGTIRAFDHDGNLQWKYELVRKLGPVGVNRNVGVDQNDTFDDTSEALASGSPITRLVVRHGSYIDAIEVAYGGLQMPRHGGDGGSAAVPIDLPSDDYLIRVSGYWADPYDAGTVITGIEFETKRGAKYGPFNSGTQPGHQRFDFAASDGEQILAFFGSSGLTIKRGPTVALASLGVTVTANQLRPPTGSG